MSLHNAAQHLAAQGRGPDDHLIHMSGKEVAGLQSLAMAHGGSLTINPETGLPEAGFLDNILPTVLGAAGMAFGIPPHLTALAVGGIQAARTGDIGQGLMAGLGAYGGGSMAQGLMGSGASALGAEAAKGLAGDAATDMAMGKMATATGAEKLSAGIDAFKSAPSVAGLGGLKSIGMAAAPIVAGAMAPQGPQGTQSNQMIRPYEFAYNPQEVANPIGASYQPGQDTSERLYFKPTFTALPPYKAAGGGLMALAAGGPVEEMSRANAVGQNTGYPQADITGHAYSTPWQTPTSQNVVQGTADTGVNRMTGQMLAEGGMAYADGGLSTLGSYAAGGNPRLLKGPGDGMSDNIPAVIGNKQPARLADGEFVVPADVVSHLGNGSTDAGAKQLYKMMDRIRQKRTGKKRQAPQVNAARALPA